MTKQGVVNIKGKNYKTVALRVQEFREQFPTYFLTTEIVKIDDEQCIAKAYAGVHLEGGQRGCLCKDNKTYSAKCCDGSLQAQGIGAI